MLARMSLVISDGWDYAAHGIWWVLTKEEMATPVSPGRPGPRPAIKVARSPETME